MKIRMVLACIITLAGCATTGAVRQYMDTTAVADAFLEDLVDEDYRHSYEYFATEFKQEISLSQHVGLMEIATDQMGDLEGYEVTVMPFAPETQIERKILLGRDPQSYQIYTYDLVFERGAIASKIAIVDEAGERKVGAFTMLWVPFDDDPLVQERVKALGL